MPPILFEHVFYKSIGNSICLIGVESAANTFDSYCMSNTYAFQLLRAWIPLYQMGFFKPKRSYVTFSVPKYFRESRTAYAVYVH